MKLTQITSRTLLGLALLGTLAAAPSLTGIARADAPDVANREFPRDDRDNDRDNDRRDDENGRPDRAEGRDRGGRRGGPQNRADMRGRDANGPGPRGARERGGPGERGPGRGGPDGRAEFGRRRDGGGRPGFGRRDNRPGGGEFGRRGPARDASNAPGPNRIGRPGIGRPGVGRPDGELTIVPQFTGVVTKVKNDREFDVRIADKTYNVYLNGAAGAVRVGQTVGLNGQRVGTNDIRSATLLQGRRW